MNEQQLNIIYIALDSLDNNPLFKGMWKYVVNNDERISINMYIGDKTLKYYADARKELRPQQVSRILQNSEAQQTILVADKIYPEAKEQLVVNNIAYIESNGNVFIPHEGLYIWIDTNKPRQVKKVSSNRAFTKTGLKVLFHLLMNEAYLDMSYRQIAAETKTSLGNITNILNALRSLNFTHETSPGELRLRNKQQLIDKWVDLYEHELKPAIEIGTFRFESELDLLNWRRIPLETNTTVWSGEPGGHLMTGMLKPTSFTLYTSLNRNDLTSQYRMVRDPDGYIKVYSKFWNYDRYRNASNAPPLLVYADLLNTGDTKNIEAANRIFDDVLKRDLLP